MIGTTRRNGWARPKASRLYQTVVPDSFENRINLLMMGQVCPCTVATLAYRGSLQVNRLIMPCLVELGAPHLVQGLVVGRAEAHRDPKPDVEVAHIF